MANPKRSPRALALALAAGALLTATSQPAAASNRDGAMPVPLARSTPVLRTAAPLALPPAVTIQPISKVASIKSYKTTVTMRLDGQSGDRAARGDFSAEMQTDAAARRRSIGIAGDLVPVLLGRYLQGVPVSRLTLYLVNSRPYIVAQALIFKVCAVPGRPVAGLDQLSDGLSAEVLLSRLTGGYKIYGTLVGDEIVNGIPTRRYRLDAETINALAKRSGATAELKSGDAWIATQGGYIVRLVVDGAGDLAARAGVDFTGDARITVNVSNLNNVPAIQLPGQCNTPMRLPG